MIIQNEILDCSSWIICYKDIATSRLLSILFLIITILFLSFGIWFTNNQLEKNIKKNKKLKKIYYEK